MEKNIQTYLVDLGSYPYQKTWDLMREIVKAKKDRSSPDVILFVEHPPVFTFGRNAKQENLLVDEATLAHKGVELFHVERGGDITWHGPGQLVFYPVFDLEERKLPVGDLVRGLERVVVSTLQHFNISAESSREKIGIWVHGKKIASIGLAVRHGISYHGVGLNVSPDLSYFDMIVPCGLQGVRMTSMNSCLSKQASMERVKSVVIRELENEFRCKLETATEQKARSVFQLNSNNDSVDRDSNDKIFANPSTVHPQPLPKPSWLKKRLPMGKTVGQVSGLIKQSNLHTVCQEAHCPNRGECFDRGTATFMIMGDHCTRNCRFCAVSSSQPLPLDPGEPERVARAVKELGLDFAVITSVTRDDLSDGGAAHFAETIRWIRHLNPSTPIEVLIPDFKGEQDSLRTVLEAEPEVLNHNVEMVERLYPDVRPQGFYDRALNVLRTARKLSSSVVIKSGFMLGLGERKNEVIQLLEDLKKAECQTVTIGQYLQPSRNHYPVKEYLEPATFDEYRLIALDMGFLAVASGPYVRSSYKAGHLYQTAVDTHDNRHACSKQ